MKIGIIKEGKVPIDRRVVLLPEQCKVLAQKYPQVEFKVQASAIRCVPDEAYREAGFEVKSDISECDIFLGVKEVPIPELIPNKIFFFFSHTIKKQSYNRDLLRSILEKNITLIDHETLTNAKGRRLIAFGRFAGIVGAYNGIKTFAKKHQLFDLPPAHKLADYQALKAEYGKVELPNIKIAITGTGRVGKGAKEVLSEMQIREVSTEDYLNKTFDEPVFVVLGSGKYYKSIKGTDWDLKAFYKDPQKFEIDFEKYTKATDLLISAHYWHPKAEALFTKADMKKENFRIDAIADITCDVQGSIPSTLRVTTIEEPTYDYNPETESIENAYNSLENIAVMAVDNLPCELPLDASRSFGEQFIDNIAPALFGEDEEEVIARATIAKNGSLTEKYAYLEDFVK